MREKMNWMLLTVMLSLPLVLPCCSHKPETAQDLKDGKYFTVSVDRLNVREKPDLKSGVIGVVNYCEEVQFIEDTKVMVSVTVAGGTHRASMFKVKTASGRVGYVFSGFLHEKRGGEFTANKKPFDIKGSWAKFYDSPNVIYHFRDGKKFEAEHWLQDGGTQKDAGTYDYDGCCRIKIRLDGGAVMSLDVVESKGARTLKEKCFVFDPNLFKK